MDNIVQELSDLLSKQGKTITFAESCTGGLLAAAITELAGSSDIFERSFVTYSNQAKQDMLGVSAETLEKHGAVSHECAQEMAKGALNAAKADIAISITGIAGPGGGTDKKPVGLVYIGIATKETIKSFENHFKGDRSEIRQQTVEKALKTTHHYI